MDGVPVAAILVVAVLLILGVLETARPWRVAGPTTARRWIANVSLYALSFGLAYAIAPLVAGIAAHPGLIERLPSEAVRLIIAIAVLDLLAYALHRASHEAKLLWRLHQPHHSDLELDVTTALRHHPIESALTAIVLGSMGALMGLPAGDIAAYGVVAFGVQLAAHANINVPGWLDRLLRPVLVTPDYHRAHHSRRRPETDTNYGQVLTIWDALFGSRGQAAVPLEFGLDDCRDEASQTLPRLLIQPMLRPGTVS